MYGTGTSCPPQHGLHHCIVAMVCLSSAWLRRSDDEPARRSASTRCGHAGVMSSRIPSGRPLHVLLVGVSNSMPSARRRASGSARTRSGARPRSGRDRGAPVVDAGHVGGPGASARSTSSSTICATPRVRAALQRGVQSGPSEVGLELHDLDARDGGEERRAARPSRCRGSLAR